MVKLIYNAPSFLLFISIALLCVFISCVAIKLIDHYVPLKFRYQENPSTVSVSALLGIIYAVLVGFIVFYEFNYINKLEEAENSEAKAMFSIYRTAVILPEPNATQIRTLIFDYAQHTINYEWPNMQEGKPIDNSGTLLIENISKQIRSFKNLHKLNPDVFKALNEISINTNALFDAHHARISQIHSVISPNIWFVLLLGSFLTLAVNYMLGMDFRLHMVSITFISLMIAAILYLVITLDRPYQGDFSVAPKTFIASLEYMMQNSKPLN